MMIAKIILTIILYILIVFVWVYQPRAKYYMVNYSYTNTEGHGSGTFTVKAQNGSELDLNFALDYLKNSKVSGDKVIHSFQRISQKQFEQWNAESNKGGI